MERSVFAANSVPRSRRCVAGSHHDEPKPEPWWDGSYMLLPLRSDAGGDDAGTLRGPDRVLLSALLLARVASSFARIAVTTL